MLRCIRSLGLLPGLFLLALPCTAGAQKLDSPAAAARSQFTAADSQSQFNFDNWAPPVSKSSEEAHAALSPLDEEFAPLLPGQADAAAEDREAGYNWKGLLWQSLAFTGIEVGFRLATDHYMRHLVAEGPFWHNYAVSLKHWDMTRWSDGDNFLVDNIGHPMQGAVSAFIEIQNSPSERRLQFSNTSVYWKSRFKGMLWATVFSTQQKIGPLGEAGLGNAGGFTYGLHCATEPCRDPNAKYTNNTGWTDFIMTPVGGTAWVVGEDLIDRYVSERVKEAHPDAVFPKILRGALNPNRSMANALRGRLPWYRDYEHPEAESRAGVYVDRAPEAAWRMNLPRYEIFPHFNALSIPVNTADCWFCRTWTKGGGVGFSMRLSRWVDFDSDVDYQPNISPEPSARAGGSLLMATFGFRTGIQTPHYALKVAVRPGFVSYDHAYLTLPTEENPTPQIGRITHFATALAINGDYALARHLALRYEFGNTPVRYLHSMTKAGNGQPPNFNWLSHEVFMTNENWTYQVGPVLRF